MRFTYHPDGRVVYYATYTAYNGFRVLPQLIETTDFRHFKINTLNGRCVQNKGMALFPRKIGDDFVMASRLDGENIYLLRSDNIHFWNESKLVHGPKSPGSSSRSATAARRSRRSKGWVLLTHGVGPMRQYWIGALCSISRTRRASSASCASRCLCPTPTSATATYRTSSIPAARCSTTITRSFRTPSPTLTSSIATVSLPELLAQLTR